MTATAILIGVAGRTVVAGRGQDVPVPANVSTLSPSNMTILAGRRRCV